jgi:hypothetical protein
MSSPCRRGDLTLGQAQGKLIEAHATVAIVLEELLHNSGVWRVELKERDVAWSLRMGPVTIGGVRPGQQLAVAHLGLPPTTHALGNERALVLGDGAPDLKHQLLVRVVADRPVEELYATACSFELFEQNHLMDVVTGKPIWCREEHQLEGGLGRLVTQMIEARSLELGTTIAIVTEDVLFGQAPIRLSGHIAPQACQLLLDRMGLLLAAG